MIVSYRDKRTERFADGFRVREFSGFARQAEKRLDRLNLATKLEDLGALPGNRLETLHGDRRAVQHPHQRSMANLFQVAGGFARPNRCRNRGLSLRGVMAR